MKRVSGPVFCTVLMMALAMPATAQETFNGVGSNNESFNSVPTNNHTGTQGVTGNPNCPPPVINGITPKNWSCKTGTQGVQGNPNCPPPVIMINGQPTTPRNWSCPGNTPATRNVNNGQWDRQHPGFPTVAGSTPCQPGGPGGYNWLNNAEGSRLPEGCVRPTRKIITRTDQRYEPAPAGSYIVPPVGPPGSYIQPEGRPGSYIVPPHGAPGSYLNTTKNGTQVHRGPGGAIVVTPGNNDDADEAPQNTQARRGGSNGGGDSYRQDTQAMQGALQGSGIYGQGNGAGYSYRQDTQAMQGAMRGGTFSNGVPARKSTTAKRNNAATANAQAAKLMNDFIRTLGNGP